MMPSIATANAPREKTRIAGFFLPTVQGDSALLPSDRWILETAVDIVRTNKDLRTTLVRAGILALSTPSLLGLGAVGMYIAVVALVPPLLIAGIGVVTLTAVAACGKKIHDYWQDLKKNILPGLRTELAARYIKKKGGSFMDEWKKRMALKAAQRKQDAVQPETQAGIPPVAAKFSGLALNKVKKPPAPKPSDPSPPEI